MKDLREEEFSDFDKKCMARALSLARRGRGGVSPNPLVGAVVAKDGRIIGEGWHRHYGGKHAEPDAIDDAIAKGHALAGAHLYCNLEPCCYTAPDKHQPACTGIIIKNGIARVVAASRDPNPRVRGGGFRQLEEAGIKVESGLFEAAGENLNEGFFTFQRAGRPFVRLKIAQSLDGRIAAAGGDSRWITDDAARRLVHRMRSRHDAVLVGRGTVQADDPQLTLRHVKGVNPFRVVLDSRLSLPPSARLFSLPDAEKTIVICGAGASGSPAGGQKAALLRERGVRVLEADGGGGEISAKAALSALAGIGIRSVFVEGGGAVYTSFLKEGLWDKIAVFIAPLLIGRGIDAVGDLQTASIADALRLCDVSIKRIGDQVLFEGGRSSGRSSGRKKEAECLPV